MTNWFAGRWKVAGLILWFAWLAFAVAITVHPFLWHVKYFRSPGKQFYSLALWLFPSLAISTAVYSGVRRRGLWRFEPAVLGGLWTAAVVFYEPVAALVVAAVFLAAYVTGRVVMRGLGLATETRLGDILVSSGLGLGALTCVLFPLGLLRLYYAPVFALLLALPILFFRADAKGLFEAVRGLLKGWAAADDLRHPMAGVTFVFAGIFLACATMVALAPSVAFDVLRIHLVEVRYYASQHALQPIPAIPYSYFPQGVEILMTLAFLLGGQTGAQLVPSLFFALFILFCFQIARECGASPSAAFAAAVCPATIPFLHWTGSVAKNDLGMACFQVAALYCYLRWNADRNFRWIGIGVFFLAMSFGVKHVALFGAVPIGLLYLWALWNQPRKIRAAVSLLGVFCIFGLFWYARTYALTGNPLYPENVRLSVNSAAADHGQSGVRSASRYVLLLWQLHFAGMTAFESPSANPLGIFLVVFLPAWILGRRASANRGEWICLFFAGVYLLYWSTVLSTLRYAVTPIALVFGFTIVRLYRFYDGSAVLVRVSILGAMIYCFLFGMSATMITEISYPQIALFTGGLDKAGYLRHALLTYPPLEFLQKHASKGDRIFSVGNYSAAYAPDPVSFQSEPCGSGFCSAARVMEELGRVDYSYLVLPDSHQFVPVMEALRGEREFDNGHFAVYKLKK